MADRLCGAFGLRGAVSPDHLRVVTLNLWKNEGQFARRQTLIREGLEALAPDIVFLQECFAAPDLGIDVARSLAAHLNMACHPAPARAKLRRHDGAVVSSTSGLAVLLRGPATARTFSLPSVAADGERIAQCVDVTPDLRLLNLHLTHLQGAEADAMRRQQITTALDWAYEPNGPDVLVAGDLNAFASDLALDSLFRASKADRGPSEAAADAPTFQGERPGEAHPASAIDHCVVLRGRGGWRIREYGRGLNQADATSGIYPSDHAAVLVTLEKGNV